MSSENTPLHYGDRPDNAETPPTTHEKKENSPGSEHHPARNGRHVKSQIDHAIELDDKIEELKHDISKKTKEGNLDAARELDKEISELAKEKEEIVVPVDI